MINGRQQPTNVSIDCNSGVYLSAVKPALEAITVGWQAEISSTTVFCDEISPRSDISGRRVCTKLVLYLTENLNPSVKCKVVLHFYHTSCTVQVQGSSPLLCGTSSPVWLVKHFLEPLATTHAAQNSASIEEINSEIRESAVFECGHCKSQISPTASHPKDQELCCSRCGKFFHKRCTDRRKTTANWKRTPWYCCDCVLGPHVDPQPQNVMQASGVLGPHSLNPAAEKFQPQPRNLLLSGQSLHGPGNVFHQTAGDVHVQERVTPSEPPEQPIQPLHGPVAAANQPATVALRRPSAHALGAATQQSEAPADHLSTAPHSEHPTPSPHPVDEANQPRPPDTAPSQARPPPPHPPGSLPLGQPPTFPSTSVRQRSSNINVSNAEFEFQKTALSTCRSNIAQQQAELKSLKETLDVRNKRILQLESQVGHASDLIAGRDNSESAANTHLHDVLRRMESLESKILNLVTSSPPNSIVINTCQSHSPNLKQIKTIAIQTDPTMNSVEDSAEDLLDNVQQEDHSQATSTANL